MGYPSDAALAIYGPPENVVAFIAAQRMKPDRASILGKDYVRIYDYQYRLGGAAMAVSGMMLTFRLKDVIWYEGHPEIAAWERLISDASDLAEEGPLNLEFVRIGEDTDDNDLRHCGENIMWFLDMGRTITSHLPEPKETSK